MILKPEGQLYPLNDRSHLARGETQKACNSNLPPRHLHLYIKGIDLQDNNIYKKLYKNINT